MTPVSVHQRRQVRVIATFGAVQARRGSDLPRTPSGSHRRARVPAGSSSVIAFETYLMGMHAFLPKEEGVHETWVHRLQFFWGCVGRSEWCGSRGPAPTESPRVRVSGGDPTENPRTKRHSAAQGGTAANMALLALTSLYAGSAGLTRLTAPGGSDYRPSVKRPARARSARA
jgi:hypothetical protein